MARRYCKTLLIVGSLSALTLCSSQVRADITTYTKLSSFKAHSQTSVVEDFESFSPKNVPLHSFTSNDITYTGLAGSPFPNVYVTSPGYSNFGTPKTTTSILTANGDEDIRIDFGMPGHFVGFDTYTNRFGPAAVEVFGASGLLGSYQIDQEYTKVGFFGITSTDPITSIVWQGFDGRRPDGGAITNTGVDNIRLGGYASVQATPEPSVLVSLFASGLVGSMIVLRRRTR